MWAEAAPRDGMAVSSLLFSRLGENKQMNHLQRSRMKSEAPQSGKPRVLLLDEDEAHDLSVIVGNDVAVTVVT